MIQSYLEHGFSLIPVESGGKLPVGKWAHAQATRATAGAVDAWLDEEFNIGLVTGRISGVVVVDCDNADALARVVLLGHDPTPTVLTGRGAHLYFRWPGHPVKNAVAIEDGIDVRGDGGFVVVPPSVHANGEPYRFAPGLSLDDVAPAELPAWALRASQVSQTVRAEGEWGRLFAERVGSGMRNQRCAELAGHLLRKYVDMHATLSIMLCWNQSRCDPAMEPGEVRRTVESIARREERRRLRA
jgi:hypothetical protein